MAGFGGSVKLTGESEYRKALSQITQSLRVVGAEMKATSSSFDVGEKSTEELAKSSKELSSALDKQKSALNTLKSQLSSMQSEYDKTAKNHQNLVDKYNEENKKLEEIGKTLGTSSNEYKNQQKVVSDLSQEVAKSSKQFDAQGKAINDMKIKTANAETTANNTAKALDNLGKEAEESGKQAEKGSEGYTIFKNVVANLTTKAITVAIDGIKKLGSTLIDITKQSYNAYASYEQLVGGVETLFGESAKKLQEYASVAYKTAGLSANEYMEQATSFSATLLQGLEGDTEKAVEYANLAIIDMSDNANKMGTSIEMIQNAYQGFAKDNYTMLDNLKLGYGGTQSEMARLINDTKVLGNETEVTAETVKDVPFDKIIEAIHKTQEQIGITGTTSKEASSTIEGSSKSIKASWENLMVAIADENADLDKSIKIFTENVVTWAKNAVPRIKQIVQGLGKTIVALMKEFMPKVADTVLPVIEKIYNGVKAFATFVIDNFDKIAPIVMGAVSAFSAFAVVMKITTIVTEAKKAIEATTGAITLATKAQIIWNTAMEANPIGIIITAIGALVTAILFLSTTMTDSEKEHERISDAIEEQGEKIEATAESWNKLKDAQKEQIDQGMTEMSYYERLADELKNITDENGKVKEGYESRASFITSQLADAMGIEIDLVDGVIQNYEELTSTIDSVMEKKKAQIILDAQESMYAEAIQNQTQALQDLATQEELYTAKRVELDEINTELEKNRQLMAQETDGIRKNLYLDEVMRLEEEQKQRQSELEDIKGYYDTAKNTVEEYAYNIANYENNMALAHEERYSEMSTATWDYVKEFQSAEDVKKAEIEASIRNEETQLATLEKMKEQSGSNIYDAQIEQSKKNLEAQKEALKQYTSETEKGMTEAEIEVKKGLSDQLSAITDTKIEFKNAGNGLVQMYSDGVKVGAPKSKQEMAKLVSDSIKEISKQYTGATTAGENLIDGVNNGIASESKQNSVFATISNFGSKLLSRFQNSLKEKSPSKATKEMGVYLLEGLGLGIKSEERNTLKQVTSFGERVVEALNSELSQGATLGAIDMPTSVRMSGQANTHNNMVSAFKDALSEMKIVLDDEVAGQFIDKTVSNLVYN